MLGRLVVVVAVLAATSRAGHADGESVVESSITTAVALPEDETYTLLGTAEIEFVNVALAGGFSNRQPGLIKPRMRDPYVDVDKVTLEAGLQLEKRIRATMELRADRIQTRIDRVFLNAHLYEGQGWRVVAQAGRQKPLEAPVPRRVETYSPLGGLFWRGREWHLGAAATYQCGDLTFQSIASVAMQRDLGDQPMGEDLGLPSIAFVNTELREGSSAELGGLLSVGARGAYVAGFGFRGHMLDNAGSERLNQTFPVDYPELAPIGEDGKPAKLDRRTSYWYGGRAGFDGHGVHVLGEVIGQRLGYLLRRGFELGASYTYPVSIRGRRVELEPFVRYGGIFITNLPERYLIPESWDRQQVVTALLVRPSPSIEIKLEYLFLRERTERVAPEDRHGRVRDDELLIQLRFEKDLL